MYAESRAASPCFSAFTEAGESLIVRFATSPQGSAKVYAAECAASPCFSINFVNPLERRTSYEEFRKLNIKWQHKLGKVPSHGTADQDSALPDLTLL